MNIRQSFKRADQWLLAMCSVLAMHSAVAAPGTLANEPLQTSSSAPPNILFHLDTSGSMDHIVAEYDSTSYSFECTDSTAKIGSGDSWSWGITGTGLSSTPYIVEGGKAYALGNSFSTRCFDPAATFHTTLRKDIAPVYLGGDVPYTGAYLNWYFNTATDGTGNWDDNEYKPGVRPRMEVAQNSLKALLGTLQNNVNVGLSTFDGGNGASIDRAIADLDTTHLGNMISSIDAASPSGYTPLAESARDIGRYFSNSRGTTPGQCGGGSSTLTIHPGPDEQTVDCALTLGSRITLAGPTQYFCQKNFSVMLTDGQPTADENISTSLQDYDQDCTSDAQSDGGYTCDSTNDEKSDVTYLSTTGHSDFWDDVTTALYDIDLRPDLDGPDGEVKNNVITYTIGFADEQVRDHPLIRQAAEQAGGEFIFAEDSAGLRQAFDQATKNIIAQSSTSSAVTFNSSTLSSQSAVYQALFNTVRWSGELRSIPLDGFTGAVLTNCTAGTDNCWSAAEQLDAQNPDNRVVLTYHPTQNQGRAFRPPADYTAPATGEIPQPLVDDLCKGPNIPNTCDATTAADVTKKSANQAYIEDLVDYLRGDRSNEGSGHNFRVRTNVLGDIVNASPVYVSSEPASNWPNRAPFPVAPDPDAGDDPTAPDNSYSTWTKTSIKDREAVVYAASNDGLLHGFRTTESSNGAGDAGNEVLAYIPTGTFSAANNAGLHYLADPAYQHLFYNDLTPTISDVYMKHRDTSTGAVTAEPDWRTMLLGGQRGGGRVLYLLDITDPSKFDETNAEQLVEWEFTHPDLGYSFSKPTIAMMNDGRFAAIFGNGYKSGEDGGTGDCSAKLFIVYLEGGQDGSWTLGSDYLVIDTTAGDAADCNGLSTPAVVDLNQDGTADRVYAGDLHGNLWAFDLCNYDTTNNVCQSTGWGQTNNIMTAHDGSGNRQPITVKPVISRDPATTGSDNLLIAFGTGQYMTDSDKTDTTVQTMYGVREYSALTNGGDYNQDPRKNPGMFEAQTISETGDCSMQVTGCSGSLRTISNNALADNGTGWMIDLPTAGERVVVNPLIRNNILFFNTLIPDSTVCSAGGSGWLMSVNLANGGAPDRVIFDINNDGVIDAGDKIGGEVPVGQKVKTIPAESTFLGDKQYTPDSEGNINVRDVNIGKVRREGRMSWRELFFE